jgi:hypothetical protein
VRALRVPSLLVWKCEGRLARWGTVALKHKVPFSASHFMGTGAIPPAFQQRIFSLGASTFLTTEELVVAPLVAPASSAEDAAYRRNGKQGAL